MDYLTRRPRRNRKSEAIRSMVEESSVETRNLIFPLFLIDGQKKQVEVASMPGIFRWSPDLILREIEECLSLGITTFDVFPAVADSLKDRHATKSYDPSFFYLKTLREIKRKFPEACIMTDVAMDPYSSDGHDGLVEDGRIVNDKTLEILGKMALAQAETGIDILGPSDMMDGRVGYLRKVLDDNGFTDVSIMSYTAKYASGFYNPFRDALDSAPKFGDKRACLAGRADPMLWSSRRGGQRHRRLHQRYRGRFLRDISLPARATQSRARSRCRRRTISAVSSPGSRPGSEDGPAKVPNCRSPASPSPGMM